MQEYMLECLEDHQFSVSSDYSYPIELIYKLLQDRQIPSSSLFVSNITDEYLRIVRDREYDLDKMCDFAKFAARLLYLKLIRANAQTQEELDEVIEQEQEIIDRIDIFHLYKEAALSLKKKESTNIMFRNPIFTDEDKEYLVNQLNLDMLMSAYAEILYKVELREKDVNPEVKTITKDPSTVQDKVKFLVEELAVKNTLVFNELFEKDCNKSDVITTFLAMLEILKNNFATAEQNIDGVISITKRSDADIYAMLNAETDVYEAEAEVDNKEEE